MGNLIILVVIINLIVFAIYKIYYPRVKSSSDSNVRLPKETTRRTSESLKENPFNFGIPHTVSFAVMDNDENLNIGDVVKLWNRPDTGLVHVFTKGSLGGTGLIGMTKFYALAKHLEKEGYYDATIKAIGNRLELDVTLKNEFLDRKQMHIDYNMKEIDKLRIGIVKKYNPRKKSCSISLKSTKNIETKGMRKGKTFNIMCNHKAEVLSHLDVLQEKVKTLDEEEYVNLNNLVWLEDDNGIKVFEDGLNIELLNLYYQNRLASKAIYQGKENQGFLFEVEILPKIEI